MVNPAGSKIFPQKFLFCFILQFSAVFFFIHFSYHDLSHQSFHQKYLDIKLHTQQEEEAPPSDPCTGRYIYIYDLPDKFHSDIIRDCHNILPWHNMCPCVSNMGLGPHVTNTGSVLIETGWHITNPYLLDFIFHNRMKQYECLTANSSEASAIFVPYYAGLDTGRHLWNQNVTVRDLLLLELFDLLRSRPEWSPKGGRDHFILAGRTTWDFRRQGNDGHLWGGKLLALPEVKNITVLLIESYPWGVGNEFAIPYPTNFHPSKESEMLTWLEKVSSTNRSWLFSFAGARRPDQVRSIRDQVSNQCRNSTRCKLLDCASRENDCSDPVTIMGLFQTSNFCLEPPGDSPTRRSTFDAMLAGCIPVFFSRQTAYTQYRWYLPADYTEYSVYIPEHDVREGSVSIEEILLKYSEEQIEEMRDKVMSMLARLIYKDPSHKIESVRDAFDVAVDGVLERVRSLNEA